MVLASGEILAAAKAAFQGDLPPPGPSKESLMLISLATGKRGSWQLHRGEHPACISGGHPLRLQEKEKPLQSRTHAPQDYCKLGICWRGLEGHQLQKKERVEDAHESTKGREMGVGDGSVRKAQPCRENRILVRKPDLPNRPRTSCLNLTEYPRPLFQERLMSRM